MKISRAIRRLSINAIVWGRVSPAGAGEGAGAEVETGVEVGTLDD